MSILVALLLPPAHAHATALLEGLDAHAHALGGLAVEASFGLLWQETSESEWRWLCHEAVTQESAIITPRYAFTSDGVVMAAVPSLTQAREPGLPIYRSEDRCSWDPAAGLEGVPVIDVATHPTEGSEVLAIAADITGGGGSSIHRSGDGGRSFDAVQFNRERHYRSLAYGPDDTAWVAAARYADPGVWVLHSPDRGRTWTEHPLPLPDVAPGTDIDADVLHADSLGAYVAVGSFRHDRIYRVDASGTATLLAEPDVELTDVDVDEDGTVWLAGNGDSYFRLAGSQLTRVDAAPVGQGVQVDGDVLRLATRSRLDGTQLAESTNGGNDFVQTFHLSELQAPPSCPMDSPVAVRCETLWPTLEARLPLAEGEEPAVEPGWTDTGGDIGPGTAPAAVQAGTRRCGGGQAWLLLLPALLTPVRRRR